MSQLITLVQPEGFTASDRCDRCGALAMVRVVVTNGDLLFCNHHGKAHADKLAEIGASVPVGVLVETIDSFPQEWVSQFMS